MPTPLTVSEPLINMYSSFQNIVHTAEQMQYTFEKISSDF